MSIKVRLVYGNLEDLVNDANDLRDFYHVTGSRISDSKIALDVMATGVTRIGALNRIAEAGSTDTILALTAHDMQEGNLIRIKTATNTELIGTEVRVKSIIDANSVLLDDILPYDITAGDTFDILRAVTPAFGADGSQIVTVASSPIQFILNGATQTVTEDTVTPANNAPLPVKLTGVTGDINITAGDLNVHLSDVGVNYDATRIGDGTELLSITANNQAEVYTTHIGVGAASIRIGDGTEVMLISTTGQAETHSAHTGADFSSVRIGDGTELLSITANNQAEVYATHIGVGAASIRIGDGTEVMLISTTGQAEIHAGHTGADYSSVRIGDGTELLSITINNQAEVFMSHSVNPSSVQIGDGTEVMQVTAAGEANVRSAQLPATLGQLAAAASTSVVLASNQPPISVTTGLTPVDFLDAGLLDTSSTNIPVAGVQVVASLAANCEEIEIVDDIGEYMTLRDGVGTILAYLPLGGGLVKVNIAAATVLRLYSETGATIVLGKIAMNFLG